MKQCVVAVVLSLLAPFAAADEIALFDETQGLLSRVVDDTELEVQLLLPGFSHHFEQPKQRDKQWNETNWGAGVAFRKPLKSAPDWSLIAPIGVMQDSLYKWGGYLGLGAEYGFADVGGFRFGAAATATAMYRTMRWNGKHVWVGAVVPSLNVVHDSGFGTNLVVLPPGSVFGGAWPGVAMLQLTYAFDRPRGAR